MKGYGLPRNLDVQSPDCADISLYGLKSSFYSFAKHGKDRKGMKPSAKARARRIWKKKERLAAKRNISKEKEE